VSGVGGVRAAPPGARPPPRPRGGGPGRPPPHKPVNLLSSTSRYYTGKMSQWNSGEEVTKFTGYSVDGTPAKGGAQPETLLHKFG
jgi:hypothetical protein